MSQINAEEQQQAPKRGLCEICWAFEARYRCPACERRTCSLECVKRHKAQYDCTGKRPRTEPVAPMNAFNSHHIMRDFGFLEEVDFAIDRAGRELQHQSQDLRLYQRKVAQRRQGLLDACACPSRRTNLVLAPAALSLARSNTSKVFGIADGKAKNRSNGKGAKAKGKGNKRGNDEPLCISWRVEWHFGKSVQVLTDRGLSEQEKIANALTRFLENTWQAGATRHLILPYAEAGMERLEVFLQEPSVPSSAEDADKCDTDSSNTNLPRFHHVSKTKSLQDNLIGRRIVEFPVLHVALPEECARFLKLEAS